MLRRTEGTASDSSDNEPSIAVNNGKKKATGKRKSRRTISEGDDNTYEDLFAANVLTLKNSCIDEFTAGEDLVVCQR